MKKKVRQSNFELLRIISMLMIIFGHFIGHSGIYGNIHGYGLGVRIVGTLFYIGGALGVNLFMLISSYFLIDTKFSLKRVLRIWFEFFFYNVIFVLIGKFCMHETYDYATWLRSLLPVTFNAAWFAVVYIFICFISPFMNRLIKSLNKKSYTALITVLFISLVGMSVLTFASPQRILFNLGSWFIFMYFTAGYIKRFSVKILDNKFVSMTVFVLSLAAECACLIIFMKLGRERSKFFEARANIPINHEFIFLFLSSVSLFMFFKNIDLGKNRVINFIAATAFGVYLIHDNGILRSRVWYKWVKTGTVDVSSGANILLRGILAAISIYVVCSVIDRVRMICVEKPIFSHLGKLDPFFEKVDSAFNFAEPFESETEEVENMSEDEEAAEPEKITERSEEEVEGGDYNSPDK